MGAPKGNQYAKGNRGGRRHTKQEELKGAVEKITSEALIELANNKVYKQLKDNGDGYTATKELALPITLKGITEKIDMTSKGKSINYGDDQKRKIAERIIARKSDTGGSGEELLD